MRRFSIPGAAILVVGLLVRGYVVDAARPGQTSAVVHALPTWPPPPQFMVDQQGSTLVAVGAYETIFDVPTDPLARSHGLLSDWRAVLLPARRRLRRIVTASRRLYERAVGDRHAVQFHVASRRPKKTCDSIRRLESRFDPDPGQTLQRGHPRRATRFVEHRRLSRPEVISPIRGHPDPAMGLSRRVEA